MLFEVCCSFIKGKRCLESTVELVHENPFVMKSIWLERCFKSMIYPHKYASKSRDFPFTLRTNTVGHFYGVKNLTPQNGMPC